MSFSPDGSLIAAPGTPGESLRLECVRRPGDRTGRPSRRERAGDRVCARRHHDRGRARRWGRRSSRVARASGRPTSRLLTDRPYRFVQFDASGEKLLTGSVGGEVRLWDIARRIPFVTLAHQGEISVLAFRPGGDAFATVCDDGTARLWESTTGRPIGEPLGDAVAGSLPGVST